jgi:Na+-transporting methylmalonyl-CoA/oxaloacetate decarboxylase gamma subunit
MAITAVIIVSIVLMILFFAVTVAGGRAHDRANEAAARQETKTGAKPKIDRDSTNG